MTERLEKTLRISLLCLLVLWGGYTFLQYLGVPVHAAVLLSDAKRQAITDACGDSVMCMEWHSIIPTITNTFERANPFLWYLLLSVLVYAAFLGYSFLKHGQWRMRFTVRPLTFILVFIGFLWLLFTVLSNTSNSGQPYRRVYMPSASVYPGADAQTIQVLTDDYNHLKQSGCLR
jgi:glucan phosphoethanolaminetransferase (alkaline phosphatase superfamily)